MRSGVSNYKQTRETLALLEILALGAHQIKSGKVQPANIVIKRIRCKRKPQ